MTAAIEARQARARALGELLADVFLVLTSHRHGILSPRDWERLRESYDAYESLDRRAFEADFKEFLP